jgi:RNA polymerase sigma factor (sigma-70 family)
MPISTFVTYNEQLWSSLLEGDKDAYARIYKTYFSILYGYGMRLCKDAELVKDCIQDLFVKLWINRENLNKTNSVSAYLYTALRYTVLNKMGQAERLARRESRALQVNSFDVHYTIEESMIHLDEQASRNRQVLEALNNLTARQKESIFLRFYGGLEYVEVAEIMQISVKACYKIIGRAIEVMRKYFKESAIFGVLLLTFLYCFI